MLVATTQLLHVCCLAGHIWSQAGHMSNLMPDLESAQNFGTVMCATTQFLHFLQLAGHSWYKQGGHISNLMPDSESAQKFCYSAMSHILPFWLETFVTGTWDHLVPIGTNLGTI